MGGGGGGKRLQFFEISETVQFGIMERECYSRPNRKKTIIESVLINPEEVFAFAPPLHKLNDQGRN